MCKAGVSHAAGLVQAGLPKHTSTHLDSSALRRTSGPKLTHAPKKKYITPQLKKKVSIV